MLGLTARDREQPVQRWMYSSIEPPCPAAVERSPRRAARARASNPASPSDHRDVASALPRVSSRRHASTILFISYAQKLLAALL